MIKLKQWYQQQVMLPIKRDPESLKSFALTMAIAFPAVFMLILPWLFSAPIPIWPLYISIILCAFQIFMPLVLFYPYLAWMHFASIVGFINTRIILALAFFLMIMPIGLFMRMRGRLQYKTVSSEQSAWQKRDG